MRDVQLSFIQGRERPVGPVLQSVFQGTNAELMVAIQPLYLSGSVLDVTYGEGGWWRKITPDPFTAHDLKTDGVDFRCLPESDSSVDTVAYDPPYVEGGGKASGNVRFLERFGVSSEDRPSGSLESLVVAGLRECCRVADRWVLVKCMEYVAGGKFHDMPTTVITEARNLGWRLHDRIVHIGGGPGGEHRIFEVLRAARAHSYLLVFAR